MTLPSLGGNRPRVLTRRDMTLDEDPGYVVVVQGQREWAWTIRLKSARRVTDSFRSASPRVEPENQHSYQCRLL